jgi:hypothetical protein
MASGRFSRRDNLDEVKNRFKFMFRSLLVLPLMLRWLKTFIDDPVLLDFLRRNPRLAAKLHRPYLSQNLDSRDKLAVLQAHYRLECARFPAHCLTQLLQDRDLVLAICTGRDDSVFHLVLTHSHSFDKEGELSLQLRDTAGISLVTLTFTLDEDSDGPLLIIGGLQGPRRFEGDADMIRAVTKSFSGLFPKRVAMETLTALARELGIERVEAVEKSRHIYNSWRYRKHFEADYDSFWLSLGALTAPDGHFKVPSPIARKSMEEIASKKRSEYSRRYTLLDDINAQVAACFGSTEVQSGDNPVPADSGSLSER